MNSVFNNCRAAVYLSFFTLELYLCKELWGNPKGHKGYISCVLQIPTNINGYIIIKESFNDEVVGKCSSPQLQPRLWNAAHFYLLLDIMA